MFGADAFKATRGSNMTLGPVGNMTLPTVREILALIRSGATSEANEKIMELQEAVMEQMREMPGPQTSLDKTTILKLSTISIATPGDMHPLAVFFFEDETEEHDDDLHNRLTSEFKEKLARYVTFLEPEFGAPHLVDLESDDVDEEAAEEALDLIEGVLYAAIWTLDSMALYIAVVRSDREAPLALVLGAA